MLILFLSHRFEWSLRLHERLVLCARAECVPINLINGLRCRCCATLSAFFPFSVECIKANGLAEADTATHEQHIRLCAVCALMQRNIYFVQTMANLWHWWLVSMDKHIHNNRRRKQYWFFACIFADDCRWQRASRGSINAGSLTHRSPMQLGRRARFIRAWNKRKFVVFLLLDITPPNEWRTLTWLVRRRATCGNGMVRLSMNRHSTGKTHFHTLWFPS